VITNIDNTFAERSRELVIKELAVLTPHEYFTKHGTKQDRVIFRYISYRVLTISFTGGFITIMFVGAIIFAKL
jgi:hypothetical protein